MPYCYVLVFRSLPRNGSTCHNRESLQYSNPLTASPFLSLQDLANSIEHSFFRTWQPLSQSIRIFPPFAELKDINLSFSPYPEPLEFNPTSFRQEDTEIEKKTCTILYYTVLYCTILYYTALYCTILHYTALYCTILYYTVLYCTILHYTVLYCTILHYTALYCTILD
jgi:hypothetical protein